MIKDAGSPVQYRPDIDGLRAIAVLVVMAFHLGIYRLHGGFVGVDVFFVISGFLICSLLCSDLEKGRFSLARFYERRIRRILPALLLVLAVTTIAAAVVLLPTRLEDYAHSLVAAALSFSNFHFYHTAGYFDAPAETRPLLHTWSLAVEEQFYLAFPLLLAFLHRFSRRVVIASLAGLGLLSFAVSVFSVAHDESAAFYLPFSRAWELVLGALLALGVAPRVRGWQAHGLGLLGLALIAGSVLWLAPGQPFPGVAALPSCLGAAFVIAAGRGGEGLVARTLAWRPVVVVGLMSYSLYLWHWPLIVLVKEATLQSSLSHAQQAGILAACFGLSLISWRFVEQPLRRAPAPRRTIFAAAGAATAFVAAAGVVLIVNGGWPQRLPADVAQVASYVGYDDPARYRAGVCFIDSYHATAEFRASECLHQTADEPSILLIGDSHAAHFWQALSSEMPNVNILQATASGCRPTHLRDGGAARCRRVMDYVYQRFLPSHHVDVVMLSAAWTSDDAANVAETLAWARQHDINVIVLGPSVIYDAPLPALLAREAVSGDAQFASRHRLAWVLEADTALRRATAGYPGHYVSTYDMLCTQASCREFVGEHVPIQYDDDHFTPEGARFMVRALQDAGVFQAAAPAHALTAAHG